MFKKALFIAPLAVMLVLAACGGSSSSNGVKITIGTKLDGDSQILGQAFTLLLQAKGYNVTFKPGLGQTPVLDGAIQNGSIDLYPEFTGTGISLRKLKVTSDPQGAYNEVKDAYKSLKITWLDAAFNLNDDYGLCTSQAVASKYNLKNISDVTAVASQLVLATQQDALSSPDVVPAMNQTYSLNFKDTVQINEQLGFDAVKNGQADVNICYTTDPNIVTQNFVLLKDDKNAFPVYNPAPIIRDSKLNESPQIASILNPFMAKLTTENITKAIKSLSVDKQPLEKVANQLLKDLGLL